MKPRKPFVPIPIIRPTMEAARASYSAHRPPTPPSPPPPPPKEFDMLSFRLDAGRTQYLIALRARHLTTDLQATHLAILHQHGKNLVSTNHRLDFYTLSIDSPSTVREIQKENRPFLSVFTTPFIFHVLQDAKDKTRQTIARELESKD